MGVERVFPVSKETVGKLAAAAADGAVAADLGVGIVRPTGVAATDRAAIAAAIAAYQVTVLRTDLGVFHLDGTRITVPNGKDLRGLGATFQPAANICCDHADAGIDFTGGGYDSGGFKIDGAATPLGTPLATNPIARVGGTGSAMRRFRSLFSINGAGDGIRCYSGQNDLWELCGSVGHANTPIAFDRGYGGSRFVKCAFVQTGGPYCATFDNAFNVVGDPYPVPADITFDSTIFEGISAVSIMKITAGYRLHFESSSFYSQTAPSGPLIDIVAGQEISFGGKTSVGHSGASAVVIAGSRGIIARGISDVAVTDKLQVQNIDKVLTVDGAAATFHASFGKFAIHAPSLWFDGINGGSANQIAFQVPNLIRYAKSADATAALTDIVELSQRADLGANFFFKFANGDVSIGDGTSFNGDLKHGRISAGVWGMKSGALHLGSMTTAQRTAMTGVTDGTMVYDSDLDVECVMTSGTWRFLVSDDVFTPGVWAASTAVVANKRYRLPTGGYGYTTARTTRASFDATERALWTFLPGGHYEAVSAAGSGSWVCPNGITRARVERTAGGGGGAGGSSALTSGGITNQPGGGGGGCGGVVIDEAGSLVPGDSYAYTVGAGGTGGAGGAANGGAGVAGGTGGFTSFTAAGGVLQAAYGGAGGNPSTPNSAVVSPGGAPGAGVAGIVCPTPASVYWLPGFGGNGFPGSGSQAVPMGRLVGGGAGANATATFGGLGGFGNTTGWGFPLVTRTGQNTGGGGGGGSGPVPTYPGCGGPGGGGGAPGGTGGTGAAGAPGMIEWRF